MSSPTEAIGTAEGAAKLDEFAAMCHDTERVQHEVLLDIVAKSRDTEWGRRYGFDEVHGVDDFRERVPVTSWDDYAEASERMQRGDTDITFAGAPDFFVLTSGTTGAAKHIPESAAAMAAKKATSDLRAQALADAVPGLRESGAILTFANRLVFWNSECGIPCGSASGSNLTFAPPLGPGRLAYPLSILENVDAAEDVDYLIMRTALMRDVRAVRGNNPGRLSSLLNYADTRRDELIDDIRNGTVSASVKADRVFLDSLQLTANPERADKLTAAIAERGALDAGSAWPGLRGLVFWLSGSVGRYMADLAAQVPDDVVRFDIGYGASEGRFNVPLVVGKAAGPVALAAQFLEFIPIDGGEPLLAHQLVDGGVYQVITTSYAGLFRYDMHDLVRVDGFTGTNPNIVFESKAGDVANIAGEKMAGGSLLKELTATLTDAGVNVRHFTVVTDYDRHGYDVCVELAETSAPLPDDIVQRVDAALDRAGMAYPIFRGQGLIMAPRVLVMASGWQDRLYERQMRPGVSRAQIKLRLIELEVPIPQDVTLTIG